MKFLNATVEIPNALEGASGWRVWTEHLRTRKALYTVGIFSVLLTDLTEVLIPKFMEWNIEALQNRTPHTSQFFWGLVFFLLLQFVGRVAWRQLLGQQTHKAACKLKSVLWDRARFLPDTKLQTEFSPGELMNMATADVGTARLSFGFTLVGTVDFIFLTVFTLIAMFSINWRLTLLTLCLIPILPFFLHRLAKQENFRHREAQESLTGLSDQAAQSVATIRLQKITQSGGFWRQRLEEAARRYQHKRFRVILTSLNFIPITGVAPLLSYAVLMFYGLHLLFSAQLSLGEFVAMQSYIFLIQTPLLELGTIVSEWQRSFSSLNRLRELFRSPEAPKLRSGGAELQTPTTQALYVLEDLSFSYGPQRKILDHFSMRINSGARIGIQGPIGSGKSTFLRILGGFETRFQGDVQLAGRPITEYSHPSLRESIAYVPQKVFLFADTLRANLELNAQYSDDEIWEFLEFAGVRRDIMALPQKLDTRLGEWGVNLSGGQKQRLTLARALLRKPKILLLDDCLSAVDTVTEEKILKSLDKFLKATTVIWVAHRESTLRHCDQIVSFGEAPPHDSGLN